MKIMKNSLLIYTALSLFLLCERATAAGRPVFDQTPEVIGKYFGEPLNAETTETETDDFTYQYSSSEIKSLIPELPSTIQLAVVFVDGRAQRITLSDDGGRERYPYEGFDYDQQIASSVFEYMLGYAPPTYQEVLRSSTGPNPRVNYVSTCLGDGVVTQEAYFQGRLSEIKFNYTPLCEPPYDYEALGYLDRSGMNLSSINLANTYNLAGSRFINTDMSYANLTDSIFTESDFSGADLTYSNLSDADFQGTSFQNADLSHADLSYSNLMGADLTGVSLAHANLVGISWDETTIWQGVTGLDTATNLPEELFDLPRE